MEEWWSRPLEPVEVAVLDSGVDATHPDLAGRIAESYVIESINGRANWREIGAATDNDANGHGTGVASIISKLAPNARIIDVHILDQDNGCTSTCFLSALHRAVERKLKVINLSLALRPRYGHWVRPLCEAAWRQGQIVVSAKRNELDSDLGLPAEFATSISVDSEVMPDLRRFRFRPGEVIEFSAWGDNITVAAKGGGYTTAGGNSFATPVLSGLCAVLLGAFPGLLPFEVLSVLKHNSI
ncbi:MAG TPA: S8 family serine peptidase [Stellaceae bacterium]|nr:S8 family serine peptidase [Stellaceae bacterium]